MLQVTPDYAGGCVVFFKQAIVETLETWDRYEPIEMSEKAKSIEQRLKEDGLINNDGSVGLTWETIPDPFCRDFPFELRHPGKVPCGYLDLMTMHSDKPPPPKTNAPKVSSKALPRRSARLQTSPSSKQYPPWK